MVVDAANVVGSRPDGWWRDRAGAARRLLTSLDAYAATAHPDVSIIVILEGAARPAADTVQASTSPLRVVLADGSGDDTIVSTVAAERDLRPTTPLTVVTADRGLRARVEALGASTVGPRWLLDRLD